MMEIKLNSDICILIFDNLLMDICKIYSYFIIINIDSMVNFFTTRIITVFDTEIMIKSSQMT